MATKSLIKHKLVPIQQIIPKEEQEKLFKELGITIEKLPSVLNSDPIISALEAEKGDVIKILRSSRTAGESIYYRVVV